MYKQHVRGHVCLREGVEISVQSHTVSTEMAKQDLIRSTIGEHQSNIVRRFARRFRLALACLLFHSKSDYDTVTVPGLRA